MSYTKTLTTLLIASFTLAATPAFAASQTDVSACRAATVKQSPGLLDGYRLRFKKEKGYQNRVISFEAIPNKASAGERFKLTCRLNHKRTVLAVNTNKEIKYAQKK